MLYQIRAFHINSFVSVFPPDLVTVYRDRLSVQFEVHPAGCRYLKYQQEEDKALQNLN
jgi:hypothetical protein